MEDSTINELNVKMNSLKMLRAGILDLFEKVTLRIKKLDFIYEQFIKENNDTLFVLGLDTFYFQKMLINNEYDHMEINFKIINNRLYRDYYNLFKIIKTYIIGNVKDKKIMEQIKSATAKFLPYDYLNIYKVYDFEMILLIYKEIVETIIDLKTIYNNKLIDLDNYKTKATCGLNIQNIIFSYQNSINELASNICQFINYSSYFIDMHKKYYNNFAHKLNSMNNKLNSDLKFDESLYNKKDGDGKTFSLNSSYNIEEFLGVKPNERDKNIDLNTRDGSNIDSIIMNTLEENNGTNQDELTEELEVIDHQNGNITVRKRYNNTPNIFIETQDYDIENQRKKNN